MRIAVCLLASSLSIHAATARSQSVPALPGAENGRAVVVAINEGGVDEGMVRSLVQLLEQAFSERGVSVVQVPDLAMPATPDAAFGARAQAAGASRVFVLHILRLNEKTLLQLDERTPEGRTLYASTLAPGDVEASDEILPRIVDAVLRRLPATTNAEVSNVTPQETGRTRSHFVLGIPGGSVAGSGAGGIELGYQLETPKLALGAAALFMGGGSGNGLALTYVYGLYDFLPGEITPYLGGGMGVGVTWNGIANGGFGALADVEAGVELLRFSHTHFDLGAQVFLPFFTTHDLSGDTLYQPEVLGTARVVF